MQLAAVQENVGSCWVQIRLRSGGENSAQEKVSEILKLGDKDKVVGILALGYAKNYPKPHTLEDIDWSRVEEI